MNSAQEDVKIGWEDFKAYVIAAAYYGVVTSQLMVVANYGEKKIS